MMDKYVVGLGVFYNKFLEICIPHTREENMKAKFILQPTIKTKKGSRGIVLLFL
jgi:hypothetical protein